jgi:hypothetical protein
VKIRYDLTIDDLVAFNRYHSDHSPAARRSRTRSMIVIALLLVGLTVVAATKTQGVNPVLFFVPLAFLAILFFLPGIGRMQIERQVRRVYADGASSGLIGPHELKLVGSELIDKDSSSETRTQLQAIERVVSDENYTFIYFSAVSAHVIPHKAVKEGDVKKFIEALERKIAEI